MFGGSLMMQGLTSLLGFAGESRSMAAFMIVSKWSEDFGWMPCLQF